MRFVDRPHCRPMRCAVIPYVGATYKTRWIDTGSELDGFDNHVYVSEVAVREMARMIGWHPGMDVKSRDQRIAELEAELFEARQQADELRERFDAIDVLASADFVARKKPGRPREKAA